MVSGSKAIVVNSSHPEVDHLAAELATRGLLRHYYGRYFPSGKLWERALLALSFTRKRFSSSLGKRKLPAGLESAPRSQPGTIWDFAVKLVKRNDRAGELKVRRLFERRNKAIVRTALKQWNQTDPVVANHGVALEIFERAAKFDRPRILNYPIAHHGYLRTLLLEEAAAHPEFAVELHDQMPAEDVARRLDAECRLATHILVGSQFVKDSFIASGIPADRVMVSSYGVDVSRFHASLQPRVPDGVFRAIWVGQISQRKGIKYLLEAWKQVAGDGMELVLAGYFMGAKEACAPYAHLFHYAGFLDPAGLQAAFSSADVFVLPTLIEGMPLVVLQAMACGLPVIVTTHGPGDIVRDGIDGFHVPIRDPNAIADKLRLLRDDPALRQTMGRNARERAAMFTWERYRKEAGDYVQSILC